MRETSTTERVAHLLDQAEALVHQALDLSDVIPEDASIIRISTAGLDVDLVYPDGRVECRNLQWSALSPPDSEECSR